MAIIPRSERQIATYYGKKQPYADFGGEAVGHAMANLGNALSGMAAEAQQQRDELDMFQTKMELTKFRDDQDKKQMEHDASITGDGRDHTANRLAQYDTDAADVASRLPNNRKAQQYAALHMQDWRGNYGNKSYQVQQKNLGTYYSDETTKLVNEQIVPNLPKDINGVRQALGQIDTVLDNAPAAMPQQMRDGVRFSAAKQIFQAWLSNAGPEAAAQAEDLLKEYQAKQLAKPKDGLPGAFGEEAPPQPKASGGRIDDRGVEFIKKLEGSRDNGWDYGQYSGPYGVKRGKDERLTLEQADARLRQEVAQVEKDMAAKIKTPLNQGQHNALVAFFYNLGTGKGRLDKVAGMINNGQADQVPGYMAQFTRNSEGGYMSGLEARRQQEIAMYRSGGGPVQVADASGSTVGQAPRTTADYFAENVIENLPKIRNFAIQAERRAEIDQNKAIRAAEMEIERQGLEKLYDRSLTRDWIEQNAGNMNNRVYSRLMNAVTPRARSTDPQTYTDLLERADEKPEDVIKDASDAYANGLLNQESFERIYSKARRAQKEDTRLPPWANEQRQVLKRALKPDRSATEDEIKAYQTALENFDQYTREQQQGKTLDRKLLTEFTQKSIEEFKTERITAGRKALPMPRFTPVGREAMTIEEINTAATKTVEALKAGKISQDQAATEAQILKRWRDALEKEAVAKGEKIAPPTKKSTPPSKPTPERKAPF